jgi:hypothetical protein
MRNHLRGVTLPQKLAGEQNHRTSQALKTHIFLVGKIFFVSRYF